VIFILRYPRNVPRCRKQLTRSQENDFGGDSCMWIRSKKPLENEDHEREWQ
jgi:hypothetical protein